MQVQSSFNFLRQTAEDAPHLIRAFRNPAQNPSRLLAPFPLKRIKRHNPVSDLVADKNASPTGARELQQLLKDLLLRAAVLKSCTDEKMEPVHNDLRRIRPCILPPRTAVNDFRAGKHTSFIPNFSPSCIKLDIMKISIPLSTSDTYCPTKPQPIKSTSVNGMYHLTDPQYVKS